jgi:putative RNA 2'-phosphotransferase
MDEKRKTKISKFLSLVLRHRPDAVGLELEEGGWADVEKLIAACARRGTDFTFAELCEVVATNDKKRFAFDESKRRIRAGQGHSIEAGIEFEEAVPPEVLYHGTPEKTVGAILTEGLKKMNRHHVHLSADAETARKVGARRGRPVVFEIETGKMLAAGFKFYLSANNVWLTESVPPEFLEML